MFSEQPFFDNSQETLICLKSAIETLEERVEYVQSQQHTRTMLLASFRCFFLNCEYISHLFLVFLLLTLNK